MKVLLKSKDLFKQGLKEVHHFQSEMYYIAILNSKPEDLHKISAGGTKSFYQQSVRGNKFISKDKQEKTELLLSEEPGIMQQLQQKSDEHAQPEEEETHPPNRSVKRRGDRNLPEANVPKSRKVAEPHAPGSSLLADTTTFLADGIIAIVKRTDQAVPSFYVHCPCHSYHDGQRKRFCSKAISITQPDGPTVLLRLRHWILEGMKMTQRDGESNEDSRRRHVKYEPPMSASSMASQEEMDREIDSLAKCKGLSWNRRVGAPKSRS